MSDDGYEVAGACLLQNRGIRHAVSPEQPQDRGKITQVKSGMAAFLVPIRYPRFLTIEKHTDHTGHVHLVFILMERSPQDQTRGLNVVAAFPVRSSDFREFVLPTVDPR